MSRIDRIVSRHIHLTARRENEEKMKAMLKEAFLRGVDAEKKRLQTATAKLTYD